MKKLLLTLLTFLVSMAPIKACSAKQYKLIYEDDRSYYTTDNNKPAPEKVRAGQTVRLCYRFVATDTSYEFYVDGERFNPGYSHETGYIIEFVMPEHDVNINHTRRNTMVIEEPEQGTRSQEQEPPVYSIDFSGQEYFYASEEIKNGKPEFVKVRKEYHVGEQVVIYYPMIATDTNYTFLLDGMQIRPDYETSKGFIIHFFMPDHDVTLQCIERNTMLPDGPMIIR